MNIKTKSVELRTSSATVDTGALQKGEDFVKAFTLGFDVDDAIAVRITTSHILFYQFPRTLYLGSRVIGHTF
jgi:rRNA processing protein Krr1/Pno1